MMRFSLVLFGSFLINSPIKAIEVSDWQVEQDRNDYQRYVHYRIIKKDNLSCTQTRIGYTLRLTSKEVEVNKTPTHIFIDGECHLSPDEVSRLSKTHSLQLQIKGEPHHPSKPF